MAKRLTTSSRNAQRLAVEVPDEIAADVAADHAVARIRVLRWLIAENERHIAEAVVEARHNFATWASIGEALGVTRQAAQKLYGRDTG